MSRRAVADDTGWIDDVGASEIPRARIGMLPYVGPVPEVDVDAVGFGHRSPQAFMVEMGAGQPPLRTHFHVVDQFQVVVRGSGRLGRHELLPGSVHYADQCTPYGPLSAGPAGLAYVTLRSSTDTGAHFMPESRTGLRDRLADTGERPPAARRNVSFDVPPGDGAPGVTELLAHDGGLHLGAVTLVPHGCHGIGPIGGSGAFLVVTRGHVVDGESVRRPGALRWLAPGQAARISAGPEGATLALLQLPARYRSIP